MREHSASLSAAIAVCLSAALGAGSGLALGAAEQRSAEKGLAAGTAVRPPAPDAARPGASHEGRLGDHPTPVAPQAQVAPAVGPAGATTDPRTTDPRTTDPRTSDPPSGHRSWGDWSATLRARPRPARDAVLRTAPARGPVALVTVRELDGRPRIDTVAVDRGGAAATVDRALADPSVLDVSIATTVRVAGGADPYRPIQWALTALGAEQAWSRQRADGVTVAVVDTGVAASHPDLAGVVLPGHDFVTPGGTGQTDRHGHGTHVAGLIAAVADNGIGIAGLAQGSRILPVRALDDDGVGSDADVASGIVWAADHGANIVNLSLGSPDYSAAEAAAVAYALGRGVLVVAAAGNLRAQGDATSYPGALPGVLAVAASTSSNQTAAFSNTGSYVGVTAPGVNLVSTYPPATYASMDGTSMAAPLVAASAALVRAANPALGPAQVTQLLEQTALDLQPPGRDPAAGYGLIQPVSAIEAARQLPGGGTATIGSGGTAGLTTPGVPPASPSAPPVDPPARTSALTVNTAPRRVGFRGLATVTFRLATVAGPLVDATLSVCVRPAPLKAAAVRPAGGVLAETTGGSCSPAITDANGLATARVTLTATSLVSARYAGSSGVLAAVSPAAAIAVLPSIRLVGSAGSVTVTVAPATSGETVRLQRRTGSTWTTVATRVLGGGGRLVLGGLVEGASYRVSVPATVATVAAVSSAVRVS